MEQLRLSGEPFGRRRFLVIGGAGIGLAALIAACGDDAAEEDSGIARVGNAPSTTALPPADINDVVLLRTASSMEHTLIDWYDDVLADDGLVADDARELFAAIRENHATHAATFEGLTSEFGGTPFTCANPRLETVVVTPAMRAIRGGEATDTAAAVPASDDPQRDVKTFAHAMESLATATYQGLVESFSVPALRTESIDVAGQVGAHSAAMALLITGVPEGYVSPEGAEQATGVTTTVAETTTTQNIAAVTTVGSGGTVAPAPPATPIPAVYAVPGQFGSLAATPLVIGAPDPETGNRFVLNLETPSLNTYVYEYITDCPA